MTTYYVDPTATGSDDGSSQADAWTSLQRAIDGTGGTQPTAGDTVLLRHTGSPNDETPSAEIDFDGNGGDTTNGYVSYIGVNSSWEEDGTRYVIDGGSLGAGLSLAVGYDTVDKVFIANVEFNNAKDNAWEASGTYPEHWVFYNCIFSGATNAAFDTYFQNVTFIRCAFLDNGGDGYYRPLNGKFIHCAFIGNSGDGFESYHNCTLIGCLFHDNGGKGINFSHSGATGLDLLMHNVVDGNTGDGIYHDGDLIDFYIGNRITNNGGYGINLGGVSHNRLFDSYNFIQNNTSGARNGSVLGQYGSLTSGTEGYEDRANDNFNLTSSASLRRTAVSIPTAPTT